MTFTLASSLDPENLDPHGATGSTGLNNQMQKFLYDPLVNLTADGEIVSGLAERWEADGAAVTFHLRDDVTCTDGAQLTASVVATNFEYVLNVDNGSSARGTRVPTDVEVSADDAAGTVTVTSSTPTEYLLAQLSSFAIVCPGGLDDRSLLMRDADGTGPYTVTAASPGNEYRLARRDGYVWGPDDASSDEMPDAVVVRIVESESTAANLLLSGEITAAKIGGVDKERLEQAGLSAVTFRQPSGQLWFNQRDGHRTSDELLRRALVQAADMGEVSRVATADAGVPSKGMLVEPLVCGGVDPTQALPGFDPGAAETTLASAGWVRAGDGWTHDGETLSLKFIYPSQLGLAVKSAVELLVSMWADAGIDVSLQPVTSTDLGQYLFETGDWDIFWGSTQVQVPTQLMPFVSGPEPPEGQNFSGSDNGYSPAPVGDSASGDECDVWNLAETSLYTSSSVVPMNDIEVPTFANEATFDVVSLLGGLVIPSTIRMS